MSCPREALYKWVCVVITVEYLRSAIVFDELCYGKSELRSSFTSSNDGFLLVEVEALNDGQKEKDDVYRDDYKRR